MALYRPFPPPSESTFVAPPPPLNQSPLPLRGLTQFMHNWGDKSSFRQGYLPQNQARFQHTRHGPLGAIPQHQYTYPLPPLPESLYRPHQPPSVPPQSSMYYPSSQYSQFNNQPSQALQPSSPPSFNAPPQLSSPSPPPPSQSTESKVEGDRGAKKDGYLNQGLPSEQ